MLESDLPYDVWPVDGRYPFPAGRYSVARSGSSGRGK